MAKQNKSIFSKNYSKGNVKKALTSKINTSYASYIYTAGDIQTLFPDLDNIDSTGYLLSTPAHYDDYKTIGEKAVRDIGIDYALIYEAMDKKIAMAKKVENMVAKVASEDGAKNISNAKDLVTEMNRITKVNINNGKITKLSLVRELLVYIAGAEIVNYVKGGNKNLSEVLKDPLLQQLVPINPDSYNLLTASGKMAEIQKASENYEKALNFAVEKNTAEAFRSSFQFIKDARSTRQLKYKVDDSTFSQLFDKGWGTLAEPLAAYNAFRVLKVIVPDPNSGLRGRPSLTGTTAQQGVSRSFPKAANGIVPELGKALSKKMVPFRKGTSVVDASLGTIRIPRDIENSTNMKKVLGQIDTIPYRVGLDIKAYSGEYLLSRSITAPVRINELLAKDGKMFKENTTGILLEVQDNIKHFKKALIVLSSAYLINKSAYYSVAFETILDLLLQRLGEIAAASDAIFNSLWRDPRTIQKSRFVNPMFIIMDDKYFLFSELLEAVRDSLSEENVKADLTSPGGALSKTDNFKLLGLKRRRVRKAFRENPSVSVSERYSILLSPGPVKSEMDRIYRRVISQSINVHLTGIQKKTLNLEARR